MADFAKSFDSKERLRAAQHSEAPIDILEMLVRDEEAEVRKFALRSLKKKSSRLVLSSNAK